MLRNPRVEEDIYDSAKRDRRAYQR